MKKITTDDGFVIEFEPVSGVEDSTEIVEGEIVGYTGWKKELILPTEFEYKLERKVQKANEETDDCVYKGKIVGIGIDAFENYIYLEKIEIPETYTSLGKFAFKKCQGLEYINIPGSINSIPDYCFIDCVNLKRVNFNEGLKKIGDFAFSGCENLSDVKLPESCYYLGFSAFEKCKALKNINILETKTKVDYLTFKDSGFEKKYDNILKEKSNKSFR